MTLHEDLVRMFRKGNKSQDGKTWVIDMFYVTWRVVVKIKLALPFKML